MDTIAITVRLPKQIVDQLNFLAKAKNKTKTDIVADAINNEFINYLGSSVWFLDKAETENMDKIINTPISAEEKRKRENFLQEPYVWDQK